MAQATFLALSGLVGSTIYLTSTFETTSIFQRPLHTAVATLATWGIIILALQRLRPWEKRALSKDHYSPIPLDERSQNAARNAALHRRMHSSASHVFRISSWKWRMIVVSLAAFVCLRIALLFLILQSVQCTKFVFRPLIPFAIACWDFRFAATIPPQSGKEEDEDNTVYDALWHSYITARWRYIVPTVLLGIGASPVLGYSSFPPSTFICPQALPEHSYVPTLQGVGFMIDIALLLYMYNLFDPAANDDTPSSPADSGMLTVGLASILSSIIGCIVGAIVYLLGPEHRQWMLAVPGYYIQDLFFFICMASVAIFSYIFSVHHLGSISTTAIVAFTCTYWATFTTAWVNTSPFPFTSDGTVLFNLLLCVLGVMLISIVSKASEALKRGSRPEHSAASSMVMSFTVALFVARALLAYQHKSLVGYHPIDVLMLDARTQHESFAKQAHQSKSLPEAARHYQGRYNRRPPPRFDIWYQYATNRSSAIIDDFDIVHNDLHPFWAMSPADIRQNTWDILANPGNDLGGIAIRNGRAEIFSNVVPTHRWMLEGILDILNHFTEWLPDMDLAFNLNDECRVAVPFDRMQKLLSNTSGGRYASSDIGSTSRKRAGTDFSYERDQTWQKMPEEPTTSTRFLANSFNPTFPDFGRIGCPPSSAARRETFWNRPALCTSCARQHSLGQFISNWSGSADPCHQPDLANLHGFYLSPAAFHTSKDLVPIFSQSRAPGYNDIRYPSAWNYRDKSVYSPTPERPDPSFSSKNATLFWRGATSEGVSPGWPGHGSWKGMVRQRMVHLMNNDTAKRDVLLPHPLDISPELPSRGRRWQYHPTSASTLRDLMATDVRFVGDIVRCGGRDCPDQETEFGFGEPVDFQDHWRYKYLIDMDGAGFSGRFLPFLQSNSLVFKTALFREWYEGRLTAWLHFVPLDLRLHDVWSVLAYFAGVKGKVDGRSVSMEPHEKEGGHIAQSGREWVEKVMRKEDMEIYFFRLLLEWGRLTDDRRDDIGYVG